MPVIGEVVATVASVLNFLKEMKYCPTLVALTTLVSLHAADCKETEFQDDDSAPSNRILGGVPVGIAAAPYMAAVIQEDAFLACATIIGSKWALTTKIISKQLENLKNSPLSVRSGVSSWKKAINEHNIVEYYIPDEELEKGKSKPEYNWGLAMLQVREKFHEQFAKLPPPNFWHPANMQVQVYGWGSYKPGVTGLSDELRGVSLRLQPNLRCIKTDTHGAPTPGVSLCTDANPRGPCQFDEGAAMMSGRVVLGLSTYSDCTKPRSYYVRISYFKRWIVKTMKLHPPSRRGRSFSTRSASKRRERQSLRNYYKRLIQLQYMD